MSLEFWFMLPTAIVVAAVAMASGVEGGTFFTPIFLLALGLPIEVAIGTGLITEVFGFASGIYAYGRKKLIDYRLGANLLIVTVPMALLGTWIAGRVDADVLKVVLGMGLLAVALSFLRAPEPEDISRLDGAIEGEYGDGRGGTCLVTSDGERICYTVCNKNEGRIIAGTGALFMGMIATGLGELNAYFLLQRCRVPSKVSVATSVFVVAITALIAAAGHLYGFIHAGGKDLVTVFSIAIFTVPGVIAGAQLGSLAATRISQHVLERALAMLFILVAVLMLADVFA
jgi:hypothetical protein